MSIVAATKKITAPEILARKGRAPIVALTAYSSITARLLDPHVDVILVGDSVGMVHHGYASTVPVTLETMILHAKAVTGSAKRALVVVDMPSGSYEESPEQAFRNAIRVMKETGAGAVKLEGGATMAPTIRFLNERGVPVMAHVGMTPQAINVLGSFRALGRSETSRTKILGDAVAVAEAGAFSVVLEAIEEPLAVEITETIAIPTIGIGASATCDGQVLVLEDMLGLTPRVPRFVKRYADLEQQISAAVEAFASEVRARTFPGPEHCYPRSATETPAVSRG